MLIFLTTAYQTEDQVESGVLRAIIDANPTEYVLRAMRDLMLTGYDWDAIGLAFLVNPRPRRPRTPADDPQLPVRLPLTARS